MNDRQKAQEILDALGGKENIAAASHCATRLRLVLNDEGIVHQKKLEDMDIVKGTFSTGGQYQIILGSGTVNKIYQELAALTNMEDMSTVDVKDAANQKLNPIQRFVKMLSDIFVPIIPAIVAGGLLMGLNNVLTASGLFFDDLSLIEAYPNMADLAALINTFANAPFVYLPVLIGFSAAKRFGGNSFLGAALGMLMVHPDLLNGNDYAVAKLEGTVPVWNILGFNIEMVGYQSTVLPVLVASYILAQLEKFLRKIVPTVLDNLLTPLLSLFITGILTFTFVGPLTRSAGYFLTDGIVFLYETAGPIGGAILGFLYAPFVITGMHHSFIAIETQLLADMAKTGGSFIFPTAAMANIAQGAAALAVLFITKSQKLKGVASASGISALLGITEPAMFGVNLKLRYPFFAALVGAAVANAYITLNNVLAVALGAAGLPGIISIRPDSLIHYVIGMVIAFVVTFSLTVLLSKRYKDKA
ncbi:sucrose-specific PTS transporter subunit IIBC [Shouchella clausii]|jgi:sucrose PTS system EIIBCA or EIIBC component|uniref:protein-N(pi)-phosphohistidine--sucrose phosphotransferase n=1 Tax=Shouchella clausii TaxID=79880 RepID=A0A268S1K2_SHOCL|nr:sucrose-specific PTS transporter subunit IIBC [Shouchella clausii]PAD42811.1 PTS maltose transporter subunit IIBC [Bacillus sp. 7520-S]MBU8597521.1 sucrose-specific PTS transporter subunit IIBC [Shouchella clausii]MEB5482277.1 sucrose-specific PTS transporter subunit IIBC [Shouchella clausii]MED4156925.1 sucrose-specific PTS transporter subunit IIBC [Shouchella clausii]MED4175435.1 sucrose-specific PTS transporter subunit IIBC [Shouchella clausii]